MTITRVAIIGLGLLGGSIGLAVKARGLPVTTTGWDRDASVRERAAGRGIGVDESEGAALGEREKQVITLVASGLSDDEIAEALGIASSTVRSHLDRIGQKTGARRRPAIMRLAQQRGLIPDEPQGKA